MINAKNVRGLTSVVLGERTASEVIHSVPNHPNLDLMTSGPLPPNPPELFGKLTFNQLLDEARAVYDWVLIDTPPVAYGHRPGDLRQQRRDRPPRRPVRLHQTGDRA